MTRDFSRRSAWYGITHAHNVSRSPTITNRCILLVKYQSTSTVHSASIGYSKADGSIYSSSVNGVECSFDS